MKAVLDIAGKKYVGEGDTVQAALLAIPFRGFARTKALLTVGEKTIILSAMQSQRLFAPNPKIKEANAKSISLRF